MKENTGVAMSVWKRFYLDREKDIIVNLTRRGGHLYYVLETPNHHSGNLITNLARLCQLPLSKNEKGLKVIRGEIPCYIDGDNREVFIFRLANTKVANIYPDGRVEMKAAIPSISKTLMSQTKDYRLTAGETIIKAYILKQYKFRTDLHTHMNANLDADVLMALAIVHQLRYPLYYIKKLELKLTPEQTAKMEQRRRQVALQFADSPLTGKYLDRKIDDNTFINFADLMLNGLDNGAENIVKIRASLAILKDGQAVFTNLEKVYLYRYVFTKGRPSADRIPLKNISRLADPDIIRAIRQMLKDKKNPDYQHNTLFQDELLWIARYYQSQGIRYAEISDTTLVKKYEAIEELRQIHAVMPAIRRDTGVLLRFLAALRRSPLTIVRDQVTPKNYLEENLRVLTATTLDPYVVGSDFVGEEINDIREVSSAIERIVQLAARDPYFVIRIHAGENDSLKDNLSHAIDCVDHALAPGQKMPRMRIGHGLHTPKLDSAKGRRLLKKIRDHGVVLEFQLTSNVRLNNLNSMANHPLKQYLDEGIDCVVGTDGAALYGTSNIDEQLSLEKLLALTPQQMARMKQADQRQLREALRDFTEKSRRFDQLLDGHDFGEFMLKVMEDQQPSPLAVTGRRRYDAAAALLPQIEELTWDRQPVILCGGSFNTAGRTTALTTAGCRLIDRMMAKLDPRQYCFVIGHKLSGYERYLVEHNDRGFPVYAFVPAALSRSQIERLRAARVKIRVSPETSGMGIYKSFNYEIFERRPAVLIAFDGNSAAENLIQEAKNGKSRALILIWDKAHSLKEKAASLSGYVTIFSSQDDLAELIRRHYQPEI